MRRSLRERVSGGVTGVYEELTMRIVRYTEIAPEGAVEWYPVHWGLVVDHPIYPPGQAPYLDLFEDGAYAPVIVEINGLGSISSPVLNEEVHA